MRGGVEALLARVCMLALLLGVMAWLATRPQASGHHPQEMACTSCHLARGEVTAENAHLLTASQEQLCARCHGGAVELSHPSGVPAKRPPPPELPLDWKGDVTCSTCHEVHGSGPGRMRTARLGAPFCESCHEASFFGAMRDQGQSIVRSGHLRVAARDANLEVDRFSAQCLECHSDRGGTSMVRVSAGGLARHRGGAANHPVGKDYRRWLSYGGYRQPGSIPKAIRLPDGMVSCVSCHEGYAREHGKLVMANDRSQICFGCHDL